MPEKVFQVIVADPPFSFKDNLSMNDVKRGAAANYSTLSIDDLKALPVNQIANKEGCVLALWCPSSLIQDGLDIMKAWGFKHKQTYVWVKTKKSPFVDLAKAYVNNIFNFTKKENIVSLSVSNVRLVLDETLGVFSLKNILAFGMGRLFRQTHEICLIGVNNNKIYQHLQNKSQRSVCFARNLKHSSKPEELQNSLEIMFNGSKIELFARRERENWVCLGNEIGKREDIRISLGNIVGNAEGSSTQ